MNTIEGREKEIRALNAEVAELQAKLEASEAKRQAQAVREVGLRGLLADSERERLTCVQCGGKLEGYVKANDIDEEWLSAIGLRWQELTGQCWETRDGETRGEGLEANVAALFELLTARAREGYVKVSELSDLDEAIQLFKAIDMYLAGASQPTNREKVKKIIQRLTALQEGANVHKH